jgi:hypothetical protein
VELPVWDVPTRLLTNAQVDSNEGTIMNRTFTLGLVLLAGVAIGGTAVSSLSAQSKGPGAYAIIDIGQITDRNSFVKDLLPKAAPAILSGGGKFVTRTEKISAWKERRHSGS